MDPRAVLDVLEKRNTSFFMSGIEARLRSCRMHSLDTILTELSWLQFSLIPTLKSSDEFFTNMFAFIVTCCDRPWYFRHTKDFLVSGLGPSS
jgi:hypothetical protein